MAAQYALSRRIVRRPGVRVAIPLPGGPVWSRCVRTTRHRMRRNVAALLGIVVT
jgi:hypothetical protein